MESNEVEPPYNSNPNIFIPNLTNPPYVYPPSIQNVSLDCSKFDINYDPLISFCSAALFVFGILFCFFGYRLYKSILFLTGLIFGLIIVLLICREEELLTFYGNVGVASLSGIMYGLICYLVPYVGFFTLGFHGGLLLGLITMIFFPNVLFSIWISIIFLFGAGIFGAVTNVCFTPITMLMSSLIGGASIAISIDYFVERFKMANWIWASAINIEKNDVEFCFYSWIVLGIFPFTCVLGFLIQYFITAKGIRIQSYPYKKRQPVNRGLTREERQFAKQAKYRYLYQVRTSGGDLLSHNFIQSVQNQKSQQLDTLSTQMSTLTQTQQAGSQTRQGGGGGAGGSGN